MKKWLETGIYYLKEVYYYNKIDANEDDTINDLSKNEELQHILDLKEKKDEAINYYKDIIEDIKIDGFNIITSISSNKQESTKHSREDFFKSFNSNRQESIDYDDGIEKLLKKAIPFKYVGCLKLNNLCCGDRKLREIELFNNIDVKGENIIVFDYVTTTGATLLKCKKLLEDAGANDVICIALARKIEVNEDRHIDEKYFLQLDAKIKEVFEKRINIDNKEVDALILVRDVISKYQECRNLFWSYSKLVNYKDELRSRVREVYSYLIDQLKEIDNTGVDIDDKLFKLEREVINILIYWDLIYKNGDIFYISYYYKLIRNLNLNYDYEYIDKSLDEFPDFYKESLGHSNLSSEFLIFFDENNISESRRSVKEKELEYLKTLTATILWEGNSNSTNPRPSSHLSILISQYKESNIYDMSIVYNEIAKAFYNSINIPKNNKEALKYINKAIEISPYENQLYLNRALIYIENNLLLNALNDIKKSINLSQESNLLIRSFESEYSWYWLNIDISDSLFGSDRLEWFIKIDKGSDLGWFIKRNKSIDISPYDSERRVGKIGIKDGYIRYNRGILDWLIEYDKLVNTNKSHRIICDFIYEMVLSNKGERQYKLLLNGKGGYIKEDSNIKLNKEEELFKYYMKKTKNYKQLTDEEIREKSKSNYNKILIYKSKMHVRKYEFNSSIISYLADLEWEKHHRDDYVGYDYDEDDGPDWLGGTETEEAFWEH